MQYPDNGASQSNPPQPIDYLLGLQSLANAFNLTGTIQAVVEALRVHVFPTMGTDIGRVALLSEDGTMFETPGKMVASAHQTADWKTFPASTHTPLAVAVNERRTILLQNHAEILTAFPELPTRDTAVYESMVVTPMQAGNRVIGGIELSYLHARTYSVWEISFLEMAAAQCAQAIERVRLQEERVQLAQASPQQSRGALLHNIINCTSVLMVAVDLHGRFLAFNNALKAEFLLIFGARIAVGMSVRDALAHLPEEQSRIQDFWDRGIAGEEFTVISEYGDVNRSRRVYEATCNNLRNQAGRIIGAVAFAHDTTARINVKQALIRSEARLEEAQAVAQLGSWEYDVATGQSVWSKEMFRLLERDPALGEPSYEEILTLFLPEDAARLDAVVQGAVQDGIGYDFKLRRIAKDGSIHSFHNVGNPVLDEHGKVVRLIGTCMDVTERERLEAQLRQSQKMDSIGRLAGGIAHDFNNLLAIIMGYAELVSESLPEQDDLQDSVHNIQNAATRAANLTQQLLAFAHKQAITPRILKPNEVLTRLITILQPLIGEEIELITHLDLDIDDLYMDANQLEQVIVNLVDNARDAMPDGGKLVVQARGVTLEEGIKKEQVLMPAGPYIVLTIADTGTGMTDEVKERLFEPFFTTKGKGKRTGLGLATVYGIVKQNKGFVWAYSEVGMGTTFKVYLPSMASARRNHATESTGTLNHKGTETILVVDDEPMLRELTVTSLRNQGYRVLEAANGIEALANVERYQGAIHLLVTDANMPQMGGLELVRKLHETQPDIAVLLVSGYSEEMFTGKAELPAGIVLLQKPFTTNDLLAKVRELLGASRQS